METDIKGLQGEDYHVAKLILIVSKASYQFDDSLLKGIFGDKPDEKRLIRILSFAAMSAARRLADHVGLHLSVPETIAASTNAQQPPAAIGDAVASN